MLKKIYYHDTDAGGVVYYANYLKYFEEARTEFFKERNIDICKLSEQNIIFAVRKVEINYKAPARYGDTLTVFTRISKFKNASLEFTQNIDKAGKILVEAQTQMVCINSNFSPKVMPEEVIQCLKKE